MVVSESDRMPGGGSPEGPLLLHHFHSQLTRIEASGHVLVLDVEEGEGEVKVSEKSGGVVGMETEIDEDVRLEIIRSRMLPDVGLGVEFGDDAEVTVGDHLAEVLPLPGGRTLHLAGEYEINVRFIRCPIGSSADGANVRRRAHRVIEDGLLDCPAVPF